MPLDVIKFMGTDSSNSKILLPNCLDDDPESALEGQPDLTANYQIAVARGGEI